MNTLDQQFEQHLRDRFAQEVRIQGDDYAAWSSKFCPENPHNMQVIQWRLFVNRLKTSMYLQWSSYNPGEVRSDNLVDFCDYEFDPAQSFTQQVFEVWKSYDNVINKFQK